MRGRDFRRRTEFTTGGGEGANQSKSKIFSANTLYEPSTDQLSTVLPPLFLHTLCIMAQFLLFSHLHSVISPTHAVVVVVGVVEVGVVEVGGGVRNPKWGDSTTLPIPPANPTLPMCLDLY